MAERTESPTLALFAGAVGGACEPITGQPLWTLTRRLQDGHPSPLSRGLYVGGLANVMSIGPTTAVQWAVQAIASQYLGPLGAAASAGFVAGVLVAGPTEQGMTVQQNHAHRQPGIGFLSANRAHGFRHLVNGGGATGIRDGFFTIGMFYGAPAIAREVTQLCEEHDVSRSVQLWLPRTVGGATAGVTAGVVSHPFATIAQKQRGRSESVSLVQAAREIAQAAGPRTIDQARAFFAGVGARACRAGIALVTIPAVAEGVIRVWTQGQPPPTPADRPPRASRDR